jgi:hypothetical protein
LAIDQIAQSGLSSLKVIYYLAQLFSLMLKFTRKLAKTWSSQTTLRHLSVDDLITLLTLTRHEVKDTNN